MEITAGYGCSYSEHEMYNFKRDDLLGSVDGLLVDGGLTIGFEVKLFEPLATEPTFDPISAKCAFDNNAILLQNTKFSDVTFVVGGKELKAHKFMLASQSPVFAAMFDNDFEEKLKNKVQIDDISLEVFQELLRFVYTCRVENFYQVEKELLVLSDKVSDGTLWIHDVLTFQPLLPQYQMDNLKSYCSRRISSTLDIDSAVEFLLLADLHQATYLKDKCIDFIVHRSDQVLATNGWQKLIKSGNSELLAELFSKLSRFSGRR